MTSAARGAPTAKFVAKRIGLSLVSLLLLSLIVFFAGQVLPGDPGRAVLGPLAARSAVQAFDRSLGLDHPLIWQYWHWVSGAVRGNFGISYQQRTPVAPLLGAAAFNSLKLAAVAFVIVVPLSILGGVIASLHVGRPLDRIISVVGLALSTEPEFVTGIIVVEVLNLWLHWLPGTAATPAGASPLTQLDHLILPSLPLVFELFGYIARMTRAGTVEALESDYARTATLKGLRRSVVVRRHVLRNSLLPTITVIATQTGYLIGGLVVIERLFNYNGIGNLIFTAATAKDFPMLEAGVLLIGVVYMAATLVADLVIAALNPRARLNGAVA